MRRVDRVANWSVITNADSNHNREANMQFNGFYGSRENILHQQ